MNRQKFEIQTPPGKPINMGIITPIRGPWLIVKQDHELSPDVKWKDLAFAPPRGATLMESLQLVLGTKAYQESVDGGIELAAYCYDTSD